jgi:hypothetical protein
MEVDEDLAANDHIYMEADTQLLDEDEPQLPAEENGAIHDTVEETNLNEEEATNEDPSEIEQYPRAGEIKDKRRPHFKKLIKEHYSQNPRNLFHPFADGSEFQLAKWLNGLPLSKVDEFCQLPWVSTMHSISPLLIQCNLGQ